MPLVLVSNDANASSRYNWKDVTGVRYHYPNGYRNLIRQGDRFVYYRGIRRADGSRGPAEYFGCGTVGDIWRDPAVSVDTAKKNWAWYCDIEDYVPFNPPVPAKIEGQFFEQIPQNLWRNGVRRVSDDLFERIVGTAGLSLAAANPVPHLDARSMPDLQAVGIVEVDTTLMAPSQVRVAEESKDGAGLSGVRMRRSQNAKIVGERAEEIAVRFIREQVGGVRDLRHVARNGGTPGWDIEYVDGAGELNAVEVKGTSGSAFSCFELTRNEYAAASQLRQRYWVYFIADCCGALPKIHRIRNPASMIESGEWHAQPLVWEIRRIASEEAFEMQSTRAGFTESE